MYHMLIYFIAVLRIFPLKSFYCLSFKKADYFHSQCKAVMFIAVELYFVSQNGRVHVHIWQNTIQSHYKLQLAEK